MTESATPQAMATDIMTVWMKIHSKPINEENAKELGEAFKALANAIRESKQP